MLIYAVYCLVRDHFLHKTQKLVGVGNIALKYITLRKFVILIGSMGGSTVASQKKDPEFDSRGVWPGSFCVGFARS